jgi:hypothetical protein
MREVYPMNKFLVALAIAVPLLFAYEVQADVFTSGFNLKPDKTWSGGDTRREAIYFGIAVADAITTSDIRNHTDIEEVNPVARAILGKNPDPLETAVYFIGTSALHYAISNNLTPRYRRIWQRTTIVVGGLVVTNNVRIGLSLGF